MREFLMNWRGLAGAVGGGAWVVLGLAVWRSNRRSLNRSSVG